MKDITRDELGASKIVDRSTFQAELDALREPRQPFLRPSAEGREEVGFDSAMAWLRRHDQY